MVDGVALTCFDDEHLDDLMNDNYDEKVNAVTNDVDDDCDDVTVNKNVCAVSETGDDSNDNDLDDGDDDRLI